MYGCMETSLQNGNCPPSFARCYCCEELGGAPAVVHSRAKSYTVGLERSVVLGGVVTRACRGLEVSAVLPAAHHFGLYGPNSVFK